MSSSRIYLSAPHVSAKEREFLLDAFDSNWIAPLGPHVNAFERELAARIGRQHGCALSSGTSAIHLGLKLLGVGEGDEVLVSSLTFSASANPITYVGAKPVFIDSNDETWNMDPNLLAEELDDLAKKNRLPKAVIPVDLYGQCCDWDSILDVCQKYEVPILEDSAEALGAKYKGKNAGEFGTISIFSFNGNKIITTSGGGMLMTDNEAWAQKVRFWSTQARDATTDNHYEHSEIGYNYRMSNLCAAVGRGQLSWLDERIAKRRANFAFYQANLGDLPGVQFMPEPDGYFSTRWLTTFRIEPKVAGFSRQDVQKALEARNIESRPIWKPMHLQPVFANCRARVTGFGESLFEDGICVPSGSNLTEETLQQVVDVICSLRK